MDGEQHGGIIGVGRQGETFVLGNGVMAQTMKKPHTTDSDGKKRSSHFKNDRNHQENSDSLNLEGIIYEYV